MAAREGLGVGFRKTQVEVNTMARKNTLVALVCWAALCGSAAVGAQGRVVVERLVPQDAVVVIQVTEPGAILDVLLHPKLVETITATPGYKQAAASQGFRQLRNTIEFLEGRLDTKWPTALRKLLGGGVTLALGPGQNALLIVDSEDPELLRELHEILLFFARSQAEEEGEAQRVQSAEYRGVSGWTFAENEVHAIVDGRLLVANKPEALKAAIDRSLDTDGASFADVSWFKEAAEALESDAVGRMFVRLEVLRNLPGFAAGLRRQDNPLGALLAAPLAQTLQDSSWLAAGLRCSNGGFRLEMVTEAGRPDPSEAASFAAPADSGDGALPNLRVPRRIAAMSFYRDLHGFYAAKDELFPERTSGLIFFENMMGIFFSGRDLTEEVMAELGPHFRFVVAEQQYDPEVGTPAVQIPAFAVVFEMRHPERFALVAEEAWQKAVGLFSFTSGQQAQPGLIIDREVHGEIKYTVAGFRPPEGEERSAMHMRYNFRPALAMPGKYVILSSTGQLAEDLIDALAAEDPKPLAGAHSLVEIDGPQLASILRANREALIRQNMVEEGHTRQEAEVEVGLILSAIDRLGMLRWRMGTGPEPSRAELVVELNFGE